MFSGARDAILILFSVPNSLQLGYVCNADQTGDTLSFELWKMHTFLKMLFIIHNLL